MSLLNQLWDDTLAGPPPDKGLGKLRKHSTFSFRSSSTDSAKADKAQAEDMSVTRSIMIGRTETETPPTSPTLPVSPFPGGRSKQGFRRSTSEAFEKASGIGNWSPRPPYDL